MALLRKGLQTLPLAERNGAREAKGKGCGRMPEQSPSAFWWALDSSRNDSVGYEPLSNYWQNKGRSRGGCAVLLLSELETTASHDCSTRQGGVLGKEPLQPDPAHPHTRDWLLVSPQMARLSFSCIQKAWSSTCRLLCLLHVLTDKELTFLQENKGCNTKSSTVQLCFVNCCRESTNWMGQNESFPFWKHFSGCSCLQRRLNRKCLQSENSLNPSLVVCLFLCIQKVVENQSSFQL